MVGGYFSIPTEVFWSVRTKHETFAMLVPSLVLSLFYPYIVLLRPNKTRDIRNVGAQFGVESV